MNLFQIIIVPLAAILFLRALLRLRQGGQPRRVALVSAIIWLVGGLCVLMPGLTMRAAALLGIGRGADLILYVFVLFFIMSFFYLYGKFKNIESDLTAIVRHLALTNPESPPGDPVEGCRADSLGTERG